MPHAGMVHALEEIHRLLQPNGNLIEIHPALEAPSVIVRSDGMTMFVEGDPGFDYEIDLRQAERAVSTIVDDGLFVLEEDRRFDLMTHASSVPELRNHFAVTGAYDPEEKDAALAREQDEMYARAQEAMDSTSGLTELIYLEPARMSRLAPVR
jgi:hypothetical protein